MVEIPDPLIARQVIMMAREWGEYGDVNDVVSEGRHGQYDFETDWSLADMDPESANVELVDGTTLVVHDDVEATYQVQVARARYNPPGKAHPAEYETRSVQLMVSIEMHLTGLPAPIINVEIW